MNNLLSYCGLVDTRISASEKDLLVYVYAMSLKAQKKIPSQKGLKEKEILVYNAPNLYMLNCQIVMCDISLLI